jgi:hypothetical protein
MKATNAIKDYITRIVSKNIPQPASVLEREALRDEVKEVEAEYYRKIQDYSDALIEELKEKHPNLVRSLVHSGHPSISINIATTSIAKQSTEDSKLRTEYISDIIARIEAGLSTVKDMDALDILIANTIERMSR